MYVLVIILQYLLFIDVKGVSFNIWILCSVIYKRTQNYFTFGKEFLKPG